MARLWSTVGMLMVVVATLIGRSGVAAELPVDLELILLVDVSGSVDQQEAELQRRGYANALMDRTVVDAIQSGSSGRIAVTYIEWADETYQHVVADWAVIDGPESARAFAEALIKAPVATAFWTAIGSAIEFAMPRFRDNGFIGQRRVIDVSGDGYSNRGTPPTEARDAAVALGITVNGLPILNTRPNPWGGSPPSDLDAYYRKNVMGGPGAFVQVAEDFESFGTAILAKLVREIAAAPSSPSGGARRQTAGTP